MRTLIYPLLGSLYDFRIFRVSGVGLGNSFFNYFHALRVAEDLEVPVLMPAWPSLKPGTVLRGERSKRFYGNLFKPHTSEVVGLRRAAYLIRGQATAVVTDIDPEESSKLIYGRLNLTKVSRYEFGRLQNNRSWIRQRLLSICRNSISPNWGCGRFIALHIRLGDFGVATRLELEAGRQKNLRLPLNWYVSVLRRLRAAYQDMPALIFSDGHEEDLVPLLKEGAKLCRNSSDLDDLLSLASASILIASNSTFSQWAAFFGNMPSVLFKTPEYIEKPTSKEISIAYLDYDARGPLELRL